MVSAHDFGLKHGTLGKNPGGQIGFWTYRPSLPSSLWSLSDLLWSHYLYTNHHLAINVLGLAHAPRVQPIHYWSLADLWVLMYPTIRPKSVENLKNGFKHVLRLCRQCVVISLYLAELRQKKEHIKVTKLPQQAVKSSFKKDVICIVEE